MPSLIPRLPDLLEKEYNLMPVITANAASAERDAEGACSDVLAGAYRFIAIAEYIVNKNVHVFIENLRRSIAIQLKLFERFEAGEPISRSFLSLMNYMTIFDALTIKDWSSAQRLAQRTKKHAHETKQFDHPFDRDMGYALIAFVLNDRDNIPAVTEALTARCAKRGAKSFSGYATAYRGILNTDVSIVEQGLREVLVGHKRVSTRYGVFQDTIDEALCVWGLGITNLAAQFDLHVSFDDPLIPKELLDL